jgi:UDP-glucose 4-epimerase
MGVAVGQSRLVTRPARYVVVGGAGFIGSHFVDALIASPGIDSVTVFDNFSSGRRWHLSTHEGSPKLRVLEADIRDLAALCAAFEGQDTVIHLASNPDIARAVTEPAIDFDQGTYLTHNVVEASRTAGVKTILYASGSGVYGDLGEVEASEDHGPVVPISTYGASKLAGEALISAYSHMFGLRGVVFRFGNVVGPRQTHGVGFDFLRGLRADPRRLRILGDGNQSKSYIHVSDVVDAVLIAEAAAGGDRFETYNVATGDYITVREIAELAVQALGLDPDQTEFVYTGGDRGWAGDVPVVRLNTSRIRSLGWRNKMSSREALKASMDALLADAEVHSVWK